MWHAPLKKRARMTQGWKLTLGRSAHVPPLKEKTNLEALRQASFVDRVKNAAYLQPLFHLHWSDDRRRDETQHYDSVACALTLFELILSNARIDVQLAQEELRPHFFPYLAELDAVGGVRPDPERHAAYFDWLVDALQPSEKHQATYYDPASKSMKGLRFYYLERVQDERGEVTLRLTSESINIYLGMLPRSVADVQAAARFLIEEKLDRGQFEEARREAMTAASASEGMRLEVEALIRRTRHDLHAVSWTDAARRLNEMIEHLQRQIEAEKRVVGSVRRRLEESDLPRSLRGVLAEIEDLVLRANTQHSRLVTALSNASVAYIEERQNQPQRAAPADTVRLRRHMLAPLLALERDVAAPFLSAVPGALVPRRGLAFNLGTYIRLLATPKRERASADEVEDPGVLHLEEVETPFDSRELTRAWQAVQQHGTLSDALAALVRDHAPREALDLAVLLAYQGFCPEGFADGALVGEFLGTFDAHGYVGDDLALTTRAATLAAPVQETA